MSRDASRTFHALLQRTIKGKLFSTIQNIYDRRNHMLNFRTISPATLYDILCDIEHLVHWSKFSYRQTKLFKWQRKCNNKSRRNVRKLTKQFQLLCFHSLDAIKQQTSVVIMTSSLFTSGHMHSLWNELELDQHAKVISYN